MMLPCVEILRVYYTTSFLLTRQKVFSPFDQLDPAYHTV